MSKGKEIIKGHTYYGTKEWVKLINEPRKSGKLSEEETSVLNGEKVAAAIDVALNYERRWTLRECLGIAREEGADRTGDRIEALLHQAEWPQATAKQKAQPEESESQPENPYMVKPPI
jgi:hypothetical protein